MLPQKLLMHLSHFNDEDKIFAAKICDMVEFCESKHSARYSFFLNERQCFLAEDTLKALGFSNYMLFGGFEGASRKVLGVFPEYCEPDKNPFPIIAVKFSYRKIDKLSHRDFLGAIMSKQIKRETVGDIVVNDGEAVAFIYNTVKDVFFNEISKIGSVGVKLSEIPAENIEAKQNFLEISGTVSSLRADCVFSLAAKMSRSQAVLLIKSAGIDINYKKVFSPSEILNCGDVFGITGYGKFKLEEIGNETKKGRIHIKINKYI